MDKVDIAIMRLREASQMSQQIYGKPLIVTDSGGKDSSVCVHLAKKAGIPLEVQHAHTTADAPETVYFLREKFKRLEGCGIRCSIQYPVYKNKRTSMWHLISEYGFPNRNRRFCCDILKESGIGKHAFAVTGVRWSESKKRRGRGVYETIQKNKENKIILNNDNDEKRRLFETCQLKAKRVCNPIIDWTDSDVWEFIRSENLEVNPLYFDGFTRVGCVGCPLAGLKMRNYQFSRYPKYKNIYIISAKKYIEKLTSIGKKFFLKNVEEYFHYWMEDGVLLGQMNIFEDEGPG